MRAFPIDESKDTYYGKLCISCGHPMRVGDVAMVEDPVPNAFIHRQIAWHKRCIEAVLLNAPAERTEVSEAVDKILASIAATGHGPIGDLLEDDES